MIRPLAIAAALSLAATVVAAQPAPAVQILKIQGVVAEATADKVRITTADGKVVAVGMTPATRLMRVKPIAISAIAAGSYIGTANTLRPDGTGVSVEVHVIPGGSTEVYRPMGDGNMMTNGVVGRVVGTAEGQALDVQAGGAVRHIVVPAGTPIVLMTPLAGAGEIKVGDRVSVRASAAADGALTAVMVSVGESGYAPPL